jgi:Sulfotransferase domain
MVWNRLPYAIRAALGVNPAGRRLTILPDDIFIVSYPRSGNTWARFLIGNLLHPQTPVTFANLESLIPAIHLFPDRRLRVMPRPRVLKSHEYFDPRYKRVIYFVRDPRDVAVSTYYYSIKRRSIPDTLSLDEFIPRFVGGEFFADFGTWEEHVRSWQATRSEKRGFVCVRYEEMLTKPIEALANIASTLQLKFTTKELERAIELSSGERMKKLEKEQSADWKLTRSTRQDVPFVREAKAGGWKGSLSATAVLTIEHEWGKTIKDLGYTLSEKY